MLNPTKDDYIRFEKYDKPQLIVVIDVEEEFNWAQKFDRKNVSVRAMKSVGKAQRIFDKHGITPVYVVDYPVATEPEGYKPLQDIFNDNRCLIGAHLHPWVNPPYHEQVNSYNSFAGNLPYELESEKLNVLTETLTQTFGERPVIYKAGRYGVGPNTTRILEGQQFEIDLSICPRMNYSDTQGPDFVELSCHPYFFGKDKKLLEIPMTIEYTGLLSSLGNTIHSFTTKKSVRPFRIGGILSRLNLLEKIWLSPEGYSLNSQKTLTRLLIQKGFRIFTYAFHSPSLEINNTPYVKTASDLDAFLHNMDSFFNFFLNELNGTATDPFRIKNTLQKNII